MPALQQKRERRIAPARSDKAEATGGAPARPRRTDLAELAYNRLEALIANCTLRPGLPVSIQELQAYTELGRTPTHQAVQRLAADTLLRIRPRHGLRIAPVDLARERTLVALRREMERFVVRLASERLTASHRNQILHLAGRLREEAASMSVDAFNMLDRRIDALLVAAAGEPFLEHTLHPLHIIFRRTGWIYHSCVRPKEGLRSSIECHLDILDAVQARNAREAAAAADRLVGFSGGMLDVLENEGDPALFDITIEPQPPTTGRERGHTSRGTYP